MKKRGNKIFSVLARLLEPPTEAIVERVCQASSILEHSHREAHEHLERFREFCLTHPPSCLSELHAGTFENSAGCCPYVGHHLFSTDHTRHLFAAKLKQHYSIRGSDAKEGPDHIAEMLKSLAAQTSVEEAREVIGCCLVPAVAKMVDRTGRDNPYRAILQAVLLTLEQENRLGCSAGAGTVYALT